MHDSGLGEDILRQFSNSGRCFQLDSWSGRPRIQESEFDLWELMMGGNPFFKLSSGVLRHSEMGVFIVTKLVPSHFSSDFIFPSGES